MSLHFNTDACICQRAYDTGFTGNARIDARLQYHYDGWVDTDAIRRSYDHYHKGVPYSEYTSRGHYCFVEKRRGWCPHEGCEYARHRPPQCVAKMRFFIESVCPASDHYPQLEAETWGHERPWPVYAMQMYEMGSPRLYGDEGHDYGVPSFVRPAGRCEDNESVLQEREAYEDLHFRDLHRIPPPPPKRSMVRIDVSSQFAEDVGTYLTGLPSELPRAITLDAPEEYSVEWLIDQLERIEDSGALDPPEEDWDDSNEAAAEAYRHFSKELRRRAPLTLHDAEPMSLDDSVDPRVLAHEARTITAMVAAPSDLPPIIAPPGYVRPRRAPDHLKVA